MDEAMSTASDWVIGLPTSSVSSRPSSSRCLSMSVTHFSMIRLRCAGAICDHVPFSKTVRAALTAMPFMQKLNSSLLDLGFFELDVLARDGIVFLEGELVSFGARILLGDVKITRIRCRLQLDLDHIAFGHN